jgi:LPS export ABC transporter protein LptC
LCPGCPAANFTPRGVGGIPSNQSRLTGLAMKTRLRIALFLALIVLLGGMALMVRRAFNTNTEFEMAQKALQLVPDAAQRIQDFHRVQVRDGRKEWEIAAAEARYFAEENKVVVRRPMLRLFLRDGRSVGVQGDEGVVLLDGKELRSVDLSGAIEVTLADYVMRTASAHYDRGQDLISSPAEVEITGGDVDARGVGMQVEVGAQKFRLLGDVQMVVRSKGADDHGA